MSKKLSDKNKSKKPRIGIFICHCGKNIAGTIDIKALSDYSKTLQDVVFVQNMMYLCSKEGLNELKNGIKNNNLNRVIIVACTPRIYEELFKKACEDAGLNKYLFEFVNIREQCSWIHLNEKEKATKKAKTLIKMSTVKLKTQEPQKDYKINIEPATLVIGGGISGMTASINLANQGFNVYLVEKENKLGGMLNNLYKLCPTDKKAENLINNLIVKIKNQKKIKAYLSSIVKEVEGYIGNFDITIEDLKNTKVENFKVGTIIFATGAIDRNPKELYQYNRFKNVITQLELEKLIKNKELEKTKNIVMIQCVGARGQGVSYCSKICCMTAIKNAKLIKDIYPDCKIYIFHRDIQANGHDYEEYYRIVRGMGVTFLRFEENNIPKISKISNSYNLNVKVHNPLLDREIDISASLVILSTPLIPQKEIKEISQMLNIQIDDNGFFVKFQPKLKPVDFTTEGIFFCGTANAPVDIKESVRQALGAASKAAIPMKKGFVKQEVLFPVVDLNLCKGCGICELVCPYSAIKFIETIDGRKAEVIPASCKGCGCCGSSCIRKSITMQHYSDEQLTDQALAALEEV